MYFQLASSTEHAPELGVNPQPEALCSTLNLQSQNPKSRKPQPQTKNKVCKAVGPEGPSFRDMGKGSANVEGDCATMGFGVCKAYRPL